MADLAIMPLVKITDLTFHRSSTGLLLGHGKFVVESAGQDQALSAIDYVPRAEATYLQISELLFGGDEGTLGASASPSECCATRPTSLERRRWPFASVLVRGLNGCYEQPHAQLDDHRLVRWPGDEDSVDAGAAGTIEVVGRPSGHAGHLP